MFYKVHTEIQFILKDKVILTLSLAKKKEPKLVLQVFKIITIHYSNKWNKK